MRKQFLLVTVAIVTALFVSGQSVAVNAEEKPATESAQVIKEETKSVQNEEIQEETKESVSAQKKLAGDSIGTATAISLGSTYNGSITSSNTKDFYKFTLSGSGRITLSGTAGLGRIDYKIFDVNGEEVWSDSSFSNSTTQMSSTNKTVDLTKGTYYFSIMGSSTGNYNFKIGFSSAEENFVETGNGNNNSILHSNPIALNTSYRGQLAENDDRDFYKFTLSSSGRITFVGTAGLGRIDYKIFDVNGEEVWSDSSFPNSTTQMSIIDGEVDLTKSTYYFSITGSSTGNYNFKIGFSSAGESFVETGNGNNNSILHSNPIALNTSYRGQLAENDDRDFYKFIVSGSKKIAFAATAGMPWIYYKIFDKNGEEVWSNDSYSKEINKTSDTVNLTGGTYHLSVSSGRTGNYSFKLSTHTHSYKNVVSKATPSRNGKIVKKCSCGATNGTSVIYAPKKMSVSDSKYTYNGKVRTPSVTVKDSKGRTVSRSNYKVTYSKGRKNVGRYTMKVTFKGNYSGSISKKFDIVPKGTSLSKVSKGRKSFTVKWKKKSSQTSGYQVQYSTNSKFKKGNKTVTIKSNKSSVKKITKLKAKKKYYVRVRTYKNVKISGKTVKLYSGWSKAKAVRTK